MPKVAFPYGKEKLIYEIAPERFAGVLTSVLDTYDAGKSPETLVREALENPVDSPRLSELAKEKRKIVIHDCDDAGNLLSVAVLPSGGELVLNRDAMVRDLHMIPAHSMEEAVAVADRILEEQGIRDGKILAIPDGVSVIVKK